MALTAVSGELAHKTRYDEMRTRIREKLARERADEHIMLSLFYSVALKEVPEFLIVLKDTAPGVKTTTMLKTAADITEMALKSMNTPKYRTAKSAVHKDETRDREKIESTFNYVEKALLDCSVVEGHLDKNCVDEQIAAMRSTLSEMDFHGAKHYIKTAFIGGVLKMVGAAKTSEQKLTVVLIGACLRHYLQRFYGHFMKWPGENF